MCMGLVNSIAVTSNTPLQRKPGDMISTLFALLAGIVTIAAPCALPVLPILPGASVGQTSRARPVFVTLGFVVSFLTVVVFFSATGLVSSQ